MTSDEHIEKLLCEVAALLGVATLTVFDGRPAWMLGLGGIELIVEHDPPRERIVVSTVIAPLPEDARTRTYELLLRFNHLWPQTGGLRMALDGPSRNAVLVLDVATSTLSPSLLCTVLGNMRAVHAAWRELLVPGDAQHAQAAPPPHRDTVTS